MRPARPEREIQRALTGVARRQPYSSPLPLSGVDSRNKARPHRRRPVGDLDPNELPGALRLLNAMERAGWISPREGNEWRGQIATPGVFHEDPQLWVDGPEG